MVKTREPFNSTLPLKFMQNPRRSDPFFVIYNHRRILRVKALKLFKQEKRNHELRLFNNQKEAQKQENVRNWNFSMLGQDQVWENIYDFIKKEVKQDDSTITRTNQFDQRLEKVRLHIRHHFFVHQKVSLFQNEFSVINAEQFNLSQVPIA